jgi:hypothetical protein
MLLLSISTRLLEANQVSAAEKTHLLTQCPTAVVSTHPLLDAVVGTAAHQPRLPSKEVQPQQRCIMSIPQHVVQAALL